ncbi:transposase [Desulfofundulus sp. TPOSR]|uniref:transposase n=1 Tax=Desulfofundulus sp. TPOSR TaxID=2714340 RepID=UPI001407D4A5|nr:transposase [Desulfofundulus sp. TPOSR]NHM25909.1 transposase [Desulfofundulus sp. TPOSR]
MYHPGEIKTPGLELLLVFLRLLYFVGAMLLVAGIGVILQAPAVVTGVVAGITAYILLSSGLFEVITYRCSHCGNVKRTIKDFGSYRCSNCGQESYIKGM